MPLYDSFLKAEPPRRNAIAAGLSSGLDDLQGTGYGAVGAVADVFGNRRLRDWANEGAERNQFESQMNGRADLDRIEDVYDQPGKYLPYLGYQVAKQIPNLTASIGAGLLVPQVAVPAALSRGAAMLPQWLGGGGLAARSAAAAAEGSSAFAARRAALEGGEAFGKQVVGGGAVNYGMGVGSLYNASVEGGDPDSGGKALAGGVPYALAETLPQAMLVNRVARGTGFSGNLLTRMGKAGGTQAAAGATSELLQNEMEMAYNGQLTPEQMASNRLNAGVTGGLVEGFLGSAGGFRGRRAVQPPQDLLDRPAFTLDGGTGAPLERDPSNQQDQVVWTRMQGPDGNPIMVPSYPGGYQTQRMDNGQRNLMSGVSEMVSGVPVELTNDELVGNQLPFLQGERTPLEASLGMGMQAPRYGNEMDAEGLFRSFDENPPSTGQRIPELFTQLNLLQPRIDANLGLNRTPYAGTNYEQQFEAAASEPTGQRVADAANGQEERNVTALEASRRRAGITDPTYIAPQTTADWQALGFVSQPSVEMQKVYAEAVVAKNEGRLTQEGFDQVMVPMKARNTKNAKKELASALSAESGTQEVKVSKAAAKAKNLADALAALQTQGQPNGALATPGVGAGGSRVAGGAVAQGSVADTGSNAAVGGRVSAPAPGVGVNGAAPAAGANGQAGQSTAVVVDPASADYQETEGIWNDEVKKVRGPAFATLRPETQSYLIQQDSITPAVIRSAAKMEESTRQETAAAANEQDVDQRIAEARIDLPKVLKVLETYPPKMQRAIQLAMGVNEYGNIVDNPISSEEAAKKAGYKDGANIRRTLKTLNITQAGVNLLHNPSGSVKLNNEARLMGENPNVGDTGGNVDAQKPGSATDNKFIAKLQQMGEAADPARPYAAASNFDLAYAITGIAPYLGPEKRGATYEIAAALYEEAGRRKNNRDFNEVFARAMSAATVNRSTTKASATDTLPPRITEKEIDDDTGSTIGGADAVSYDEDAGGSTGGVGPSLYEDTAGDGGPRSGSESVSEPPAAAGKSPTVTVKTRRKFGVAAAEQSDGASQEAPISVTLNLNGGQTVFADAKKAIRQLDQKIERQKALLGCLRG